MNESARLGCSVAPHGSSPTMRGVWETMWIAVQA
jgi:hypothetical protein